MPPKKKGKGKGKKGKKKKKNGKINLYLMAGINHGGRTNFLPPSMVAPSGLVQCSNITIT